MTARRILAVLVAVVVAGALGACGAASTSGTAASATPPPSPVGALHGVATKPPMKTVGIIGGVSWVSTVAYYRYLNEMIRDRFGPTYSAPILLYSIPFGEFSKQERLADKGDWAPLRATMVDAAKRLEAGGADFIIIASNTMNSTDDLIAANVGIPVLNIVDAVGGAVQDRGLKTIALLGTKYTMEQEFYRGRLEGDYGLKVVTPDAAERDYINDVIFDELCAGVFKPQSRRRFEQIVDRLVKEEGAEGVILGCTEIPLLMRDAGIYVPTFDTTRLHAAAAVSYSLGE